MKLNRILLCSVLAVSGGSFGWLNSTVAAPAPMGTVRVASGLNRPIFAIAPPGDTGRLFFVEQRGVIRILDLSTNTVLPAAFLNIDSLVPNISGNDERGLLGLAFHPDYANNGHFFVNYTNNSSDTIIARYTVAGDPATSNTADAGSAVQVLFIDQPFPNHNGGWIGFGPNDGELYIATGDGGSACDPGQRSQDITNQLLGKMLRINVDILPYTIPVNNPFVGVTGDDEIWAYGLRNPYRSSFDRVTGDLWIGDVGQNAREEIDFQPNTSTGGENYGWDCREGNSCANTVSPQCNGTTNGCNCAIVNAV
ncbi:MAG: PQQ-dependent sugar dehydrogenase, partial [Planctomycetota bacterium]|nr:PQQ-dependent sugar dehydrogenase [Planctomycetota bacterium]